MSTPNLPQYGVDALLKDMLVQLPTSVLELVFGSVAQGRARANSDLDIAVAADKPLTAVEKMDTIADLAEQTGCHVDRINLNGVAEPLAINLKKAVGFRNIAVHNDDAINWHIVRSISKNYLVDFSAFVMNSRDEARQLTHEIRPKQGKNMPAFRRESGAPSLYGWCKRTASAVI